MLVSGLPLAPPLYSFVALFYVIEYRDRCIPTACADRMGPLSLCDITRAAKISFTVVFKTDNGCNRFLFTVSILSINWLST